MRNEFFASLLASHTRLIEIATAVPDGSLIVEHFRAREALSEPFRFEIDCLSPQPRLALRDLLGAALTLRLLLADGGRRSWHGHIIATQALGSDGGLARYRLIVGPWLAFLEQRRDNRIFVERSVTEILGEVFAAHPAAQWSSELTAPLPRHGRITQYRESDLAFVQRLLAEAGLSYRFTHEEPADPGAAPGHARLIVFDCGAALPEGRQACIRYHRRDATEASDTLQTWQETRSVQPNAVSLASWDYRTLVATAASVAEARHSDDEAALPLLEIHEASRAGRFASADTARRQAAQALSAHSAAAHRFAGEGSVRSLAAGTSFTLLQHAAYVGEAARFTVLAVEHEGANNLGAGAARLFGDRAIEAGSYRNRLRAQPARLPVVPPAWPRHVARAQTAQVVGLPGEAIGSERDHHVRIRFAWQRGAASKALDEPSADEPPGSWVRLAEWLAGPDWGSHFLPRIGSEVLVDFIDGDIDRPVVVGQLHNGVDLPPFSAAGEPPLLAGWMSHNLAAGYNQWLVDDAPGALRTRLACSGEAGQLTLGHLIHQLPPSVVRGAGRGSGFELHTDAWLALRGGEGLLLSTWARPGARGSQLDVPESAARLQAALNSADKLSAAAQAHGARPLAANSALAAFLHSVAPPPAEAEAAAAPRFAEAVLLAESPASIAHATPASSLAFAAGDLSASVQQDAHLASGATIAATAGRAASFFSAAGGIHSIAAAGRHSLQAHTGPLEILADQALTLSSSRDEVLLLAKGRIVLQAGSASVTLDGGDITFACPGTFSIKGSAHAFLGPQSAPPTLPILPSSQVQPGQYDQFFVLRHANSGKPVARRHFRLRRQDGSLQEGVTDAEGRSPLLDTASRAERLTLEILPEAGP